MTEKEIYDQHNQTYRVALEQAKQLCENRTLGIEQKGFIAHILAWALEKQNRLEKVETELVELKQKKEGNS